MPALFVLFETAAGYSLFEVIGIDELGQSADAVQQSTLDLARFGKVVKLTAFAPFKNAAHALDEVNAISEAVLTDDLKNFLEVNMPKVGARSPLCDPPTIKPAPCMEDILSTARRGRKHIVHAPPHHLCR